MKFDKAGRQQRMAAMSAIAMGENDNPQDMFDEVQDLVHLNDTAAPTGTTATSAAEIRDIYEMKLPTKYHVIIEQAESKDQREQLANHVPVITQGAITSGAGVNQPSD